MTSHEIKNLLSSEKGVIELYKYGKKYFDLVDTWANKLTDGDLLEEFELSQLMDRTTGVYSKLAPICGCIESLMSQTEYNTELNAYSKIEKIKTTDIGIVKATARASINQLRFYFSDFNAYLKSAEKMIISAQARIKRLTIEKGARKVGFSGDTSNQPSEAENEPEFE